MANTFNLGNGSWAQKTEKLLAYNAENDNYKPLPFDFDRASTATRVNKQGLIETVGVDKPRIDFLNNTKGHLLLEPSRQNLITYSEDLSNFTQTNTSTTDNVAISPSGILNASKTVPNTSNTFHWIGVSYSVSSSVYTQSIFAKADTYSHLFMILRTDGGVNRYAVKIDLSNGTIVNDLTLGTPTNTSYKIENYGNGWYRCSISSNHSSGNVIPLYSASVGGALTSINNEFQGDGTSGIYIWGAQLETGYLTSYIPTQGSAVTRAADSCSQTVPDGIIGQTEGSIFIEINYTLSTFSSGFAPLYVGEGTYQNAIYFSIETSGIIYAVIWENGIRESLINMGTLSQGINKIALSYEIGNLVAFLNGVNKGSDTLSALPSPNKVYLGQTGTSTVLQKTNVLDVKLYNTRLSNSELAALTQV